MVGEKEELALVPGTAEDIPAQDINVQRGKKLTAWSNASDSIGLDPEVEWIRKASSHRGRGTSSLQFALAEFHPICPNLGAEERPLGPMEK